jgi:hypothetical protein
MCAQALTGRKIIGGFFTGALEVDFASSVALVPTIPYVEVCCGPFLS